LTPDKQPSQTDDRPASAAAQLHRLQEEFATRLSARGEALWGRELTVTCEPWCRQSYAEFLATVPEHTCCHILAAREPTGPGADTPRGPGEPIGHVWLDMQRRVAFVLVDALLGGSEGLYLPDRPLTAVERGLLRYVIDAAAECLTQAWCCRGGRRVGFEVLDAGGLGAPGGGGHVDRPVTVLTFHLAVSGQGGALRLCLPETLLRPSDGRGGGPGTRGPLEISVVTSEVTLQSSELAALSLGDILTTDTPADGEVVVRVAGIPKFLGRLGTCDGRRAVTITRRITALGEQGDDS